MKRTNHSMDHGTPSYEIHALTGQIEAGAKPGSFTGMASVFGSIARGAKGPTQFTLDAFDQSIRESGGKFPLLWQHADDRPIGVAIVKSGPRGLEIHGTVTQNTLGKDVTMLLKDGAIDGVSIGFDAEDHRFDRHAAEGSVRVVTRAKLHEISLVTFPADQMARVRQVHSAVGKLAPEAQAIAGAVLESILGREAHEGRTFSTKNISKMKEACTVLCELIRSVEPDFAPEAHAAAKRPNVAEQMRLNALKLAEAQYRMRAAAIE